ncbi:MAG: hypothetical protein ACI3ZY_13150 [Parabacteroides sp.]
MKRMHIAIGILLIWLAMACGERKHSLWIDAAERLITEQPDSAQRLLDRITLPDLLSDSELIRWCLLYGHLVDTLQVDFPYTGLYRRAAECLDTKGTPAERSQLHLYTGRAYAGEKDYKQAMKSYLEALSLALSQNDDNQAGYCYSYIGDLFDLQGDYAQSRERYLQAEHHFLRAGNQRSAAFALREVGRMYAFADSAKYALPYMHRADSLLALVGDPEDLAYIANALGNIYNEIGQLDLAKAYHFQSIQPRLKDNGPDYLSLAEIYIKEEQPDSAAYFLDQASRSTYDKTQQDIPYYHYLLAKSQGNFKQALSYFEQYNAQSKSRQKANYQSLVLKAERQYNYLKFSLENEKLTNQKRKFQTLWLTSLGVIILLFMLFWQRSTAHKRQIAEQALLLQEKTAALAQTKTALRQKQELLSTLRNQLKDSQERANIPQETERLAAHIATSEAEAARIKQQMENQRKDLLLTSRIVQKMRKEAKKTLMGSSHPAITEEDWIHLGDQVEQIYPGFSESFSPFALSQAEQHYILLSLLDLDSVEEARLLNILPNSVSKTRQRIRRKMGVIGEAQDLHAYIWQIAQTAHT